MPRPSRIYSSAEAAAPTPAGSAALVLLPCKEGEGELVDGVVGGVGM